MKKLVFIKFGGGLITDKKRSRTAKIKTIKKLAREFKTILQKNKDYYFILGNGAGSFGHYEALKYRLPSRINSKKKLFGFAVVQESVKTLNMVIVNELLERGIPAVSIHQSSLLTSNKGKLGKIFTEALEGFLKLGIIPVIYGDIVYDEGKGSNIFSTEDAFSFLIEKLARKNYKTKKVIYLTTVDGVLDRSKTVIKKITQTETSVIKKNLFKTEGYDVTGGMKHKIMAALNLARKGIKTYIANGNRKNSAYSAVFDRAFYGTILQ